MPLNLTTIQSRGAIQVPLGLPVRQRSGFSCAVVPCVLAQPPHVGCAPMTPLPSLQPQPTRPDGRSLSVHHAVTQWQVLPTGADRLFQGPPRWCWMGKKRCHKRPTNPRSWTARPIIEKGIHRGWAMSRWWFLQLWCLTFSCLACCCCRRFPKAMG